VSLKILIVDDEPAVVRLCEQILVQAAYQVTTTTDPEKALEYLSQENFGSMGLR
jgi:CheY-like chemotaxis protein